MQLGQAGKEVTDKLRKKQNDIIFELGRAIIMDSPVDTGLFRGNWRFSYQPTQQKLDRIDTTGQQAINELTAFLNGFNGGVMWMLNGLPYGVRLEYGWSSKAPDGMVRRNISRINAIVAKLK